MNGNDLVNKDFVEGLKKNRNFESISAFLGEDIENLVKGLQRIKNKSKSSKFQASPYLQYFSIFGNYLQSKTISFQEFKGLNYNDRNLIYSQFIADLESKTYSNNLNKSSIRNQVQSKVQSLLKRMDLRVEQAQKSVKVGTSENHKKKIALTQEILKMIYGRLESKQYKLLFLFHINTGLRFSDLLKGYQIQVIDGHWTLKDVQTEKEDILISFIPLSSEFKQLVLELYGKKPESTNELFSKENGNSVYLSNYNERLQAIVDELIDLDLLEKDSKISSHSIRKFFYNQWLSIGDVQLAEYMMGHNINLGAAYSQYQILEKYKQIEEKFFILTKIIDKSEKIKDIKEILDNVFDAMKKQALEQLEIKGRMGIVTENPSIEPISQEKDDLMSLIEKIGKKIKSL